MAFERLNFSKNWNNSADFPTLQTDEIRVREDMQLLHDESRNALNALMDALENGGRDALVRYGSEEVRYIRMNDSGGLEVSSDGVRYIVVSSGEGGSGGAAPATHAAQHRSGGSDPIRPADIGAQPTVTGAATTITGSDLIANRALVTNSSGKVAVSDVTATELGYLDGVTSGIQNQLNGKAASVHSHTATDVGATRVYTSLDSIGLSIGSETIESIMAALPAYSDLRLQMTSGYKSTEYPATNGTLIVQKYGSNRAVFSLTKPGQSWLGLHLNGVWGGWKQVSTTDLAVSKAGDTMTGALNMVEGSTIGGHTPIHAGNAAAELATLGVVWEETGSYTGTASGNVVELTFSRRPKFIAVYGTRQSTNGTERVYVFVDVGVGAGSGWRVWKDNDGTSTSGVATATASGTGNTVKLTGSNLNNDCTYNWVAHG